MTKKWYAVHVFSNFEKKVAESLREAIEENDLGELFDEVLVPSEDVSEFRQGRKVVSERRFMPGYVLAKMVMNDQTYHIVRSIPRVTGFLGPQGKPVPLRDSEVARLMEKVEKGAEEPRSLIRYVVGEKVRVMDGPLESFAGVVEEVDDSHNRLKLSVSIFGRLTPVELEFNQVQKIT